MVNVKILRTTGSEEDIISKSEVAPNQLFVTDLSNKIVTDNHDIGDVLIDDASKNRFALVAKNTVNDKISVPALRLAITKLLFELHSMDTIQNGLLISRYQFSNKKEETAFICSLSELCMLFYTLKNQEDIEVKLIIADSKEED